MLPRRDRNGADGGCRRAVDDLRADRKIDQRVVRLVDQTINPGGLEEDAGLLTEHFVLCAELGKIDVDRTDLAA
jgi:hypothetical protein